MLVRFFNRLRIPARSDRHFRPEAVSQDFRYAARQLRRNPAFAITVILTLALGIGASTAVFSVAYGVLIDPFPYRDVHTLATPKLCGFDSGDCHWSEYTPAQFNAIAEHTDLFNGVTASTVGNVVLTGQSEPQRVRGNYITPNTFGVLGVQPILGRATVEDDVRTSHEEVALLSYRYWQAHYGGSRSILGRTLNFDGHPRTIIGVMPPRFLWRGADVYLPIQLTNHEEIQGQRYFALVGRLKPGVTEAQAAAELKPIFNDFSKTAPREFPKDLKLGILPFDQMFQSDLASTLYLLLGSVFVLLFIACVNVSSLSLARAVNREHEFVVRASVGASRSRLIRHAFTESLLLALAAVPVALLFAYAGLQATLRVVPPETIPDEAVITMNVPVLLASLGLALCTVVIFGLAPALHSAHPRLAAALNSIRSSGSRTQHRLLSGCVVTEIALSLALLMLAGLMVRSLLTVESAPVAFPPDRTLIASIPLTEQRYPTPESRVRFFRELLNRAHAIPGVAGATLDTAAPVMQYDPVHVQIDALPVDRRNVNLHLIDPEFLVVSGRKLLQGHFLDAREMVEQSHDAVITENFVKRYFAGENVLGRTVHLPEFRPDEKNELANDAFTVVGVISDLPLFIRARDNYPNLFLPYTVAPAAVYTLILHTSLPAGDLINPVRRTVYSIDSNQPVTDAVSLRQMLDMYGYAGPRFSLALFGSFAGAAMLLSVVGIYGVLSFVTSQRKQEIGIRMALGATRGHVMWMVVRQAGVLALIGVGAGLPLAFVAGHLAKSELIHTSQLDPFALIAAICIPPLLAMAGTYLPARRAAAVEPVAALRAE